MPDGFGHLEGFHRQNVNGSSTDVGLPRAFGDYQYYASFGGDQYLDLPAAIDNIYGTSGIWPQVVHVMSQPFFEAAGYTAMGKACAVY